jgi:hypothetical protein
MNTDIIIYISIAIVIMLILIIFICFPKPTVFYKNILSIKATDDIREEVSGYIKIRQKNNSFKRIIPMNHGLAELPLLNELIKNIPICQIGFIVLPKNFCQELQTSILCNGMIRCILCIDHSTYLRTGISVDKQRSFFLRGEWVFFDASRSNYLFNLDNYEDTILMWIDIPRDSLLPTGIGMIENDELCKSWLTGNH